MVLPITSRAAVAIPGIGYKGDGESYLLKLGEIGYVMVFPMGFKGLIGNVAIYLKTDKEFQPLRKPEDFKSRINWDKERLGKIEKLIEAFPEPKFRGNFIIAE